MVNTIWFRFQLIRFRKRFLCVCHASLKNNSDQTYSCPSDWRLSASWGINWRPPWSAPYHHSLLWHWGVSGENLIGLLWNGLKSNCIYHFPNWFRTANGRCPFVFQINRKMVNTIWFQFDLIQFRKYFSVCSLPVLTIKTVNYFRY